MADIASPSQAFTFPSPIKDDVGYNSPIPHFGRMDDSRDFDASFSFPARPSISSSPERGLSHTAIPAPHLTPVTRTDNSSTQPASMHSQLQTFSFPSSAPVNPSSRPATVGAFSSPATPTRSGRGHRRTNSDFISGDVGLGVSLKARHASVDAGFVPAVGPAQPFDLIQRPQVSVGHGRKSSLATTPLRQTSLVHENENGSIPTGSEQENSRFGDQETPRATQPGSAGGMPGRGHGRTLSSGFTPTQRPIPRARVGFADRVDFIPRPLSTISSQSGSSMSTVRHSISASTASAVNSPLRTLDHSPSPPAALNEDFVFPARPQTSHLSTSKASFEHADHARPVSAHASVADNMSNAVPLSMALPGGPNTTPTKSKRKMGSWIHRGRQVKSTLPPHVNAQQLNAPLVQEPMCESPTEQSAPLDILPRSSSPVELSYDFDADPTMVVSTPVRSQLSKSAPEVPVMSHSPKSPHKVEEPELIDLDLAVDFARPSPYKTQKGRSFNAARKSMHSGSGSHRRVESAPSHIFFDPEQYRTAHNTSTSGQSFEMEDVFEEEDEVKAAQTTGAGSSTDASATTSFEADRLSIPSMQRPSSSSQNDRPRIKFDEANRRLQFKRNSVGGYPRRHSPGLGPTRPATSHAEATSMSNISLPQAIQLPESTEAPKDTVDRGSLKQKDSVISRPAYTATEASSSVSSPYAPSQNDFDKQHRGSTTTMATSIVESGKAASIASGEPGPDIRNSEDVSTPLGPPITGPNVSGPARTPLQPLHLNSRPLGMRSVSSTMSLASKMSAEPSARRKRSSLGNLSRLLGGADRSAISLAPIPATDEPITPRKANRLSRVLKFWKPKPSPA